MSQDLKCYFGLHKYEVLERKEVTNKYDFVIGIVIISRCSNCGKIKETVVYNDLDYRR